jgi:soluble lytic murein transglycosylase
MERYRAVAAGREPVPGLPAAQQRDLADDASFLAVWLLYDAGRYGEAAPALRAWARAHPRARRAEDARWFAAWSLVRLGDRPRARAALARLVPGPLEAPALYWLGRLAEGRRAQRALYRRARAAAGPDGWYGQLAASRLLALGDALPRWPLPRGAPPGDGPGTGATGDALARAAALLSAGLPGPARAELAALSGSRRVRAVAARAAQLAEAAGDIELPARLARDHLLPSRRALRWSHPDAWPDRLPLMAARAGVERWLLLAVVRRESGFRPGARSAAGAEGLLQLLPATAERFAVAAGLPADRPPSLRDPDAALALGALYLGLLQDRFPHPGAALAAYNAGPAATAPWTRILAGQPLDEWVENLGFRETRRYVKAVLADAQVYRWLRAGGDLAVDGLAPVPAAGEGVAF